MTIHDLLKQCDDAGIELWADGPNLRYRGDASRLSADALDVLKRHKAGILAALNEPADRELCLSAGARHGYPAVSIRPGETLPAGADGWRWFTANASIPDVRAVLCELAARELCQLDERPSEYPPETGDCVPAGACSEAGESYDTPARRNVPESTYGALAMK